MIVTYRREEILLETIQRVLELEPPPAELVVVDQTRSHAPAVEAELSRLSSAGDIDWVRQRQASIPRAMNAGLLRARSEVVLFLDDDVVPEPGLVAAHRKAHLGSGAGVVAGQVLQPGEAPLAGPHDRFRSNSAERGWVTELIGANFSIRRDLALAIGGVDENFLRAAYGYETELCARAIRAGAGILFEPHASVRHLKAPAGGTRAYGSHLRTVKPGHSVGAFYRILRTSRPGAVPAKIAGRFARSVRTRHHRSRPWWIPVTLVAETLGLCWAIGLAVRGPRLLEGSRLAPVARRDEEE